MLRLLLPLVLGLLSAQLSQATSQRPNILLLMAEDMSPRLGGAGQVGGILERLEQDGLADSTIVIWTTDHGDGLPRAKRDLFDSGIKFPTIIRWPTAFRPEGLSPGSLDTRLISFVDLAPTVLTLAGVDVPAYMHGQDFASPDGVPRDYIYASRDRNARILIEPVTPGSSLEYRLDGGGWHLYTLPVYAGGAKRIEARAVRYGWKESDIVAVP